MDHAWPPDGRARISCHIRHLDFHPVAEHFRNRKGASLRQVTCIEMPQPFLCPLRAFLPHHFARFPARRFRVVVRGARRKPVAPHRLVPPRVYLLAVPSPLSNSPLLGRDADESERKHSSQVLIPQIAINLFWRLFAQDCQEIPTRSRRDPGPATRLLRIKQP